MARKRMIDPSFWEDEKLGTLEPMARLLFMGLISQADDEGRLKGHPSLLRSLIFPYDHEITLPQLDDWLSLLAADDRKLIVRYEIDNQKYIFIRNFKKHQTINKPQKSKLPEPKEHYGKSTVVVTEEEGTSTAQGKLIEVNRSEVEGKVSEVKEDLPTPFNHPLKDRIYNYSLKCELKGLNIVSADDIFYFFEKVEIEVIEHALKKSFQKHLNFAMKILNDWISEGKTTIDQVNPKSKVGDNIVPFSESVRQGSATGEVAKIEGKIGLLPSAFRADIEAAAAEWEANNVRKV